MVAPAIFGVAGDCLTAEERQFFRDAEPAGFILFGRNCRDENQLRALTAELRSLLGRDLLVLVDQEGGRVARLRPPAWPEFPAAAQFDALFQVAPISAIEAARANAQALALTLRACGINVNSLPLLDVRQNNGHAIIGDRALGAEPKQVAALGRAVLEGMAAGGVTGIIKHLPGHGRASVDSHVERPVVEASEEELELDLAPFRRLRDAPMGMAAHIVYSAWDAERPASLSPLIVADIIRGRIGFDGLLLSDDIGMAALSGGVGERAAAVLAAGCDIVLHCSGELAEMIDVAAGIGTMGAATLARLDRVMTGILGAVPSGSYQDLAAKRDALLSYA